jgi:hypothetical protein
LKSGLRNPEDDELEEHEKEEGSDENGEHEEREGYEEQEHEEKDGRRRKEGRVGGENEQRRWCRFGGKYLLSSLFEHLNECLFIVVLSCVWH